jgi:hypothetical protein
MKRSRTLNGAVPVIPILLFTAASIPGNAQILNGSFETGDFAGWNTTGFTAAEQYTSAQTADGNFASFEIHPTQGNFEALAATDYFGNSNPVAPATLETFLGLNSGSLSNIANAAVAGDFVDDGSAFKQTFSVAAASTLSFDWNFLTNETLAPINNDYGFYTLDSSVTELADAGNRQFFSVPGGNAAPYAAETGWSTVSLTLSPGTYTLGFGAVNIDDNTISSGLLIDNVTLTGTTATTPEPGTLARLISVGVTGLLASMRRRRHWKQALLSGRA